MKLLVYAAVTAGLLGACAEDPPQFLPHDDAGGDGGAAASVAVPNGGDLGTAGKLSFGGYGAAPNDAGGQSNTNGGDTSGAGDTSDAGGAGAPMAVECDPSTIANDCTAEECYAASCIAGRCQYAPLDAGEPCGPRGALFCNGAGTCAECYRDTQCESAAPCSVGDCNADGKCEQQLLSAGETCDDGVFCNGDERCDGDGACLPGRDRCAEPTVCNEEARQCVGCNSGDDCPEQTPTCEDSRCVCTKNEDCAVVDECRVGRCDLAIGTCHVENVRAGTKVGAQKAGDCRSRECNGDGAVRNASDDDDVPTDPGGGCTRPACNGGESGTAPRGPGTLCGDGATECSAADTCNGAGSCQLNHLMPGTVLRNETTSNCRRRTCDGSGNPVETPTDAACNDGLFCTGTESCSAQGACQSTGNPCTTPRPFCAGNACVVCIADNQCSNFSGTGTGHCIEGGCTECTDATVGIDCGGSDTGCNAGRCYVKCNCSEPACGLSHQALCSRH